MVFFSFSGPHFQPVLTSNPYPYVGILSRPGKTHADCSQSERIDESIGLVGDVIRPHPGMNTWTWHIDEKRLSITLKGHLTLPSSVSNSLPESCRRLSYAKVNKCICGSVVSALKGPLQCARAGSPDRRRLAPLTLITLIRAELARLSSVLDFPSCVAQQLWHISGHCIEVTGDTMRWMQTYVVYLSSMIVFFLYYEQF